MSNIDKLLRLKQENPELEMLPMVDGEISGGEYSYYMGSWGEARVEEVYYDYERIYFRSEDEEELIEEYMDTLDDDENLKIYHHTHKMAAKSLELKAKEIVDKSDWEKVIVVKIDSP